MHWGSKFKEKMLCYVALKPRICHKIKNLMILNVCQNGEKIESKIGRILSRVNS